MNEQSEQTITPLNANAIHSALGTSWPLVLASLGIKAEYLQNRHGACPACGGKDRFRFDNHRGRGDFYCNGCGAGDGFTLLQRVHSWSFADARRAVIEAARLNEYSFAKSILRAPTRSPRTLRPAKPTARVLRLLDGTCHPDQVPSAVRYLRSRQLWPLPAGCSLRAHDGTDYWHEGRRIGRFQALVASVVGSDDELVTAHITYLKEGRKLLDYPPRKLLGPLSGHQGCAIRLLPVTGCVLGIAEGIETALAASALHDWVPTWAAISSSQLALWRAPEGIQDVLIFADRDGAGIKAARQLAQNLKGHTRTEILLPPPQASDWAEVLQSGGFTSYPT